jgi:RimJ/RimL family protein N-acetyltransferase
MRAAMIPAHADITIRPLREADLPAYKDLRDRMLQAHPEAFTSDADEERGRTPASYGARIGLGPDGLETHDGSTILGAFARDIVDDEVLVGAICALRETRKKTRHRMDIVGLMVDTAIRKRGTGAALLEAAVEHARSVPGVARLTLSVTAGNEGATRLYERAGFTVQGRLKDAIRVGDRRLTKLLMTLPLDGEPAATVW